MPVGITLNSDKTRYVVRLTNPNKKHSNIHVGSYHTLEEAIEANDKARAEWLKTKNKIYNEEFRHFNNKDTGLEKV